ncbi:MAG: hypothetical protein O7F76_06640, partial [Planctomycetota bacterium]|nr:hypothetical protein [Planctomycetota bacterium]
MAPNTESTASTEEISGLRKAAILLVSIDKESASTLMTKLSATSVEDVTQEVAMMGEIDEAQRASVVAEFHALALAKVYTEEGGIAYARDLLLKALPKDEADRIMVQI